MRGGWEWESGTFAYAADSGYEGDFAGEVVERHCELEEAQGSRQRRLGQTMQQNA